MGLNSRSENWNCFFLGGLVRAVSMHPFEEPPKRVLELGCGTGVWVLEACKLWPVSALASLVAPPLTMRALCGRTRHLLVSISSGVSQTSQILSWNGLT